LTASHVKLMISTIFVMNSYLFSFFDQIL